jgi:hypothetical protein
VHFFDDLERAFDEAPNGVWRVHFHVPVDTEFLGPLGTTRREIGEFLAAVKPEDGIRHYEVETYAWNVLPMNLRRDSLARGIADELIWTRAQMMAHGMHK